MTLPAAETLFDFEATGLVGSRAALGKLLSRELPANDVLFAGVRHLLAPLGFSRLADLYLSEDDGQGNREIRVFVVIRLAGTDVRGATGSLSPELVLALETLATVVCCDEQGTTHLDTEGWQLANNEIAA